MAYNRYQYNIKVIDPIKKKQRLNTTIYSKIETNINDIYLITKQGDRLDLLADRYYKDVSKWIIIARANNIGKGTMNVEAGIQIRIPSQFIVIDENDRKLNS